MSQHLFSLILLLCFLCPSTAADDKIDTPIQMAALAQALHNDKWDMLCEAVPEAATGGNPQVKDDDNITSLGELVILVRARDCLRNLLRVGLTPTVPMIKLACDMGSQTLFTQLLDAGGKVTPEIILGIRDAELLAIALEKDGDANACDDKGRTLLMLHQEPKILKILIAKGANVNARDKQGRNALIYQRQPEVLEYLISEGADATALDHRGHSPIDYWEEDEQRTSILHAAGAKKGRPLDKMRITTWEGVAVMMSDIDEYAYMITNANEQTEQNATATPHVLYYLASRSPIPLIRETDDWHVFLGWLKELPEGSSINHYERCETPFSFPEEWKQEHNLAPILESLSLKEGEERVFCVCEEEEARSDHQTIR